MMNIKPWRVNREHEVIPRGWGVSFRRFMSPETIIIPIPFHVLVAWMMRAYYWLCFGHIRTEWWLNTMQVWAKPHIDSAHDAGHKEGYTNALYDVAELSCQGKVDELQRVIAAYKAKKLIGERK